MSTLTKAFTELEKQIDAGTADVADAHERIDMLRSRVRKLEESLDDNAAETNRAHPRQSGLLYEAENAKPNIICLNEGDKVMLPNGKLYLVTPRPDGDRSLDLGFMGIYDEATDGKLK